MKWGKFWGVINSPLAILLIGSFIGWLLLHLVWFPHEENIKKEEYISRCQAETDVRLTELIDAFNMNQNPSEPVFSILNGAESFNPEFKNWSLKALIYTGWGKDILRGANWDIRQISILSKTDSLIRPNYFEALQRISHIYKETGL